MYYVFFPLRAAAHSKMNKHEDAVADCKKAIEIDPSYGKAYGRKGYVICTSILVKLWERNG